MAGEAGGAVRRLPVRVQSEAGESLNGYLERLAWAHGLTRPSLIEALSVTTSKTGGGARISS